VFNLSLFLHFTPYIFLSIFLILGGGGLRRCRKPLIYCCPQSKTLVSYPIPYNKIRAVHAQVNIMNVSGPAADLSLRLGIQNSTNSSASNMRLETVTEIILV
jgi:hypothetical protein